MSMNVGDLMVTRVDAAVVAVVVLSFVLIVVSTVAAYSGSQRPTIVLNKAEWECTKSEQRTHLQPMLVGKITVMVPIPRTVCMEYRLRKGENHEL